MTKQLLNLIVAFLCITTLVAQEPAQMQIELRPADAQLRINGREYSGEIQNDALLINLEFPPGDYLLEFWHPQLEMEILEVSLQAGEVRDLPVGMRTPKNEYAAYLEDLSQYRKGKIIRLAAPILLGGINAALWLYILDDPVDNSKFGGVIDNIEVVRENYANAIGPVELQMYESQYNELILEYDQLEIDRKTKRTIGIPVMVGVGYLSFKLLQGLNRRERRPRPVFNNSAPFTFDYTPDANGHSFTARFTF